MINLIELAIGKKVNSPFGPRDTGIAGASKNHKGIDITLKSDNIPAVLTSTVLDKGTDASRGNWISVKQSDGTTATYMHLAKLPVFMKGETIAEGAYIGIQGNTGISSGKHLHYEVQKDGQYLDPEKYFTGALTDPEYLWLNSNAADVTWAGVNLTGNSGGLWANVVRGIAYLLLVLAAVVLFFLAFESEKGSETN